LPDAHFTLSQVLFATGAVRTPPRRRSGACAHGARPDAERELVDLLEQDPDDANARQVLEALRAAR